jgi:hypothetical protein
MRSDDQDWGATGGRGAEITEEGVTPDTGETGGGGGGGEGGGGER